MRRSSLLWHLVDVEIIRNKINRILNVVTAPTYSTLTSIIIIINSNKLYKMSKNVIF